MEEGDVVDVLCHMRKHGGKHLSTLPGWLELPRAPHQGTILPLKGHHVFLTPQRPTVVFLEHGFVFPQVHVRGRARTKDL
jgi:hypothetical protein